MGVLLVRRVACGGRGEGAETAAAAGPGAGHRARRSYFKLYGAHQIFSCTHMPHGGNGRRCRESARNWRNAANRNYMTDQFSVTPIAISSRRGTPALNSPGGVRSKSGRRARARHHLKHHRHPPSPTDRRHAMMSAECDCLRLRAQCTVGCSALP